MEQRSVKLRLGRLAGMGLILLVAFPAYGFDLSRLLAGGSADHFKIIHVQALVALLARDKRVMVFDANTPDVRASEGIIPGAHLLPSSGSYDVAGELPRDKNTPLVFYCHDSF